MFSLNILDYPMSPLFLPTLDFSIRQVEGTILNLSYSLSFFVEPLLHALKLWGGVGVGGCLQHFSVSPRPLGLGFGTKGIGVRGLGPGLDNFF